MTQYREILKMIISGQPRRSIANLYHVSPKTITRCKSIIDKRQLSWEIIQQMSDADIDDIFSNKRPTSYSTKRVLPDLTSIHQALITKSSTRKKLWEDYCADCQRNSTRPISYSHFCDYVYHFETACHQALDMEMCQGDVLEQWGVIKRAVADITTGEILNRYIFIAYAPYSQMLFLRSYPDKNTNSLVDANINLITTWQCAPRKILIEESLSAYTRKSDRSARSIQPLFNDFLNTYQINLQPQKYAPSRARAMMNTLLQKIISEMKSYGIVDENTLNSKLSEIENRYLSATQPGGQTRKEAFLLSERPLMIDCCDTVFEPYEEKAASVMFNYHVFVDGAFYSVPHKYSQQHNPVIVRIYSCRISIFLNGMLITEHSRTDKENVYITNPSHMPTQEEEKWYKWNSSRIIDWADKIGPNTRNVIDRRLQMVSFPPQAYRVCIGILQLSKEFSAPALEAACADLPYPSYRLIKERLAHANKQTAG